MLSRSVEYSSREKREMHFAMRLSFGMGLFMLILKGLAYLLTDSAAILSDAAESVIHVFAVGFAAYSMWYSLKPADQNHLYGHEKINFFSAGFEGAMIMIAALFIFFESFRKILFGFELQNLGVGILFIMAATLMNLFLGLYLLRKGKKYQSLILEANGKHILTDCWTGGGVLLALALVQITQIPLFDPLIAIAIAANIVRTGVRLIKKSIAGLMDQTDPQLHREIVHLLEIKTQEKGLSFHHLRHRMAGNKALIEFHLLFPGDRSLMEAHELASELEASLKQKLPLKAEVLTHLEPIEQHDRIHHKYGLSI